MSATEQDFTAAGAECVAGDLILNRVVVGRYRNGQFILTDEGAMMELPTAEDEAGPAAAAPAAALKPPAKRRQVKAAAGTAPEAAGALELDLDRELGA